MPDTYSSSSAQRLGRRPILALAAVALVSAFAGASGAIVVLSDRLERVAGIEDRPAIAAPTVTVEPTLSALTTSASFRATPVADSRGALLLPTKAVGVVTDVLLPRGKVGAGQAVLEIEGRPLIAMPGRFPFYRDLAPGDRGPDVRQLQNGLRAAGWDVRDRPGFFGSGTARAIRKMYFRVGYEPTSSGNAPAIGESSADLSAAVTKATSPRLSVLARELWTLPILPVTIAAATVRVGTQLQGGEAFGSVPGPTRLRGELPSDIAPDQRWKKVQVMDAAGSAWAARLEPGEGSNERLLDVRVLDGRAKVPAGSSYEVRLIGDSTPGPVLVLPVSAVRQSGDGKLFVLVDDNGTIRKVTITTGVVAGDEVQVVPADRLGLTTASRVVIGGA